MAATMDPETHEPQRDDYTLHPSNITLQEKRWVFYVMLEKQKFYNSSDNTLSFYNLKTNHQHDARLLLFFYYLTFCFNGTMYQVSMEAEVVCSLVSKSLPVRDGASKYYTFVFVLPWPTENVHSEHQDMWLESDTDDTDEPAGGTDEPDSCRPLTLKSHVIRAFMRLLGCKLNLISNTYLFVKRLDSQRHLDTSFQYMDYSNDCVAEQVTPNIARKTNGQLFNVKKQDHDSLVSKYSLLSMIVACMKYLGIAPESSAPTAEHNTFWNYIKTFMSIVNAPVYKCYKKDIPRSLHKVYKKFFRELAGEGTRVSTDGIIVFSYSWADIITESDLLRCFKTQLHQCHVIPSNAVDLHAYACSACQGEQMCIHTYKNFYGNHAGSINQLILSATDNFSIIFPHLHTIHIVLKEAIGSKGMVSPTIRPIYVRWTLYSLLQCMFQSVANVTALYTNMMGFIKAQTDVSLGQTFVMTKCNKVWLTPSPFHAAKVYDKFIINKLFGTFRVTRLYQAYVSLSYIISNTAPRSHIQRFMLVNYTGPGEGKTFVNDLLKELFLGLNLTECLGSFTPRAFVHNKKIRTCCVVTVEDLANAVEKNLPSGTAESGNTTNTFKQILDTGILYTDSTVTTKTAKSISHQTMKVTSVQNSGFIWNTNTLENMSNAWLDRSLMLTTEYGPPIHNTSMADVATTIKSHKLDTVAKTMLYRQNIVQVVTRLCDNKCLQMGKGYSKAKDTIMMAFNQRFPTLVTHRRPVTRNGVKVDYLVFAEAMKHACNIAFDLWVPPWTAIPALGTQTVDGYMTELAEARFKALSALPMHLMIIDVLVFYKLMVPAVMIDHSPRVLGIDLSSKAVKAVANVYKAVVLGDVHNQAVLSVGQANTLVMKNVDTCNLQTMMGMPWLSPKQAKNLLEVANTCYVHNRSGCAVQFFTYRDKSMHIARDNMYDAYNAVFPAVVAGLWTKLKLSALKVYTEHKASAAETAGQADDCGTAQVFTADANVFMRLKVTDLTLEEQFVLECLECLPGTCRIENLNISAMSTSATMVVPVCYGALLLQSSLEGKVDFCKSFYCDSGVTEAYGWVRTNRKRNRDGTQRSAIDGATATSQLRCLLAQLTHIDAKSFHHPKWLLYNIASYAGPCVRNASTFCKTVTVIDHNALRLTRLNEHNTRGFEVPEAWEYDDVRQIVSTRMNTRMTDDTVRRVYSQMLFTTTKSHKSTASDCVEITSFVENFVNVTIRDYYGL